MPITEYDNAAKWAAFFRRLPLWLKAIISIAFVAAVAIYLYSQFGPIRSLRQANDRLKTDLSQSQADVVTLRDRKDELHRENLHLKELIDPIQRKAELIYPELETAAAIAKLAEEVQDARSLATRVVYKPLVQDRKQKMVAALRLLHVQDTTLQQSVTISCQQGSSTRTKVANDLKKYIQEAGWKVEMSSGMFVYSKVPPDITIKQHLDDILLGKQFGDIIGENFINEQIDPIVRNRSSRGHLEITINGDPLFSESGVVTFR
jgi:hypothetical protein